MRDEVKYVLKQIIRNKSYVVVDEVDYDFEAPTETGKEVSIDLFPSNCNNGIDSQKYYSECMSIYNELNAILPNDVMCDIDVRNTWNFIYVIM